MPLKTAFITLNPTIPSRKANAVSVMNTCSQLAMHGLDLELVVPRRKGGISKQFLEGKSIWDFYAVPNNFKITHLPCPIICAHPRYFGYTMLAVSYALLRGKSLVYTRHLELACLAALYGRMSIFESHNYLKDSKHPLLPYWIRMLSTLSRSVAMIVTTHTGARAYEARGVPSERILVAPNGVDVNRFAVAESKESIRSSLGLPNNKTIVAYSGHLYKEKGSRELLECAKYLGRVLFLIIGGEPEDIDRCRSLAQKLSLFNVTFVGYIPQSSLPKYLLASDILLMPQLVFPWSAIKIFDYLAAGRPIVATDFETVREILQDRSNAVLVPPGSGEALASGIRWLLDNPETARKLGEQAGRDAIHYSWENRAARIVSWLKILFNV